MFGLASGTGAIGVFGDSTATSGSPTGVFGRAKTANGSGVLGRNLATTGEAVGVQGISPSPDGVGVLGSNSAASGVHAYGVLGTTASVNGAGVRGEHGSNTGSGVGVSGLAGTPQRRWRAGAQQRPLRASPTASTVRRTALSAEAVRGLPRLHAGGLGVGVEGETKSTIGVGVFGHAEAASGGTGVLGSASHSGAIGGSFQGTNGAFALQAAGPVQFTTSGIATVIAGE